MSPPDPEQLDWRDSLRADPLGLTRHFAPPRDREAPPASRMNGADPTNGTDPLNGADPTNGADPLNGADPTNGGADGSGPTGTGRNQSFVSVLRPVGVLAVVLLLGFLAGVGETVVLILAFLGCIVLHELGHYLMAKWGRIKVTEFYVGFGPRLWSVRRGETDYGVRALPLGGYCRIIGMHNLEEVDPADEARTYRQAPLLRRLSVAVAGSAMHFLIALCLLFAMFFWAGDNGFYLTPPATQPITNLDALTNPAGGKGAHTHSPAQDAGFRVGDRIVSIDGRHFPTYAAMRRYIESRAGQVMDVTVSRAGHTTVLHPTPVDILATLPASAQIVALTHRAAIAAPEGHRLHVGDRFVSLDGQTFTNFDQLRRYVQGRRGQDLSVVVRRDGHDVDLGRIPVHLQGMQIVGPGGDPEAASQPTGFLGIETSTIVHSSLVGSVSATGGAFAQISGLTLGAFGHLVTLQGITTYFHALTDKEVADSATDTVRFESPVGIVRIFHQVSGQGAGTQLWLLAVINISVGLFNLIPLLPLDGGHVAIALYEGVRSRRGRRYHADVAKLLPLLYLTIGVIALIALSSLFLDLRDLAGPAG